MAQNNKRVIEIPTKELNEILKAYNTIGNFLEQYIDPELLYKQEFTKGIKAAFDEIRCKKTKKVNKLKDLGG
ncbi:MAG: hypothetical protein HY769_04285 [Candidatus Stahlbacteria bacterium]|nr:hypothetical protein [Candidatus Stahlbacteria bacterium]